MPYLCKIRTDVPNSILQVLDLDPNTSQRSLIYEPPGQTRYCNRVENDTVSTVSPAAPIATVAAYNGLAAYLIDNVEGGGLAAGTAALTAADTNTIALAIIAALDAGTAMSLSNINALLSATIADTELTSAGGSASTGSLTDLLSILAGRRFTLPQASVVDTDGSTFTAAVAGSFDDNANGYRHTHESGALQISLGEGHLSQFIAATFLYKDTASAALIVYDDDGSVMS